MVLAALTYTAIRKTAIDYSIPIFYPDEITLFGQGRFTYDVRKDSLQIVLSITYPP